MNKSNKKRSVIIRVTYIGDSESGKEELRKNCFGERFDEDRTSQLGADFSILKHELKDINIIFQFWSMSVVDKHKAVREVYYKKTGAVVLVYDVTKPDTFQNLPKWLEEIWKSVGKLPMVIIGNNANLRSNKAKKKHIHQKLQYHPFSIVGKENICPLKKERRPLHLH